MPSESPFTRHGRSVEGERAPKIHALTGSPRESLLQIAHREMGEWRDWRTIARANGLIDPVDPYGHAHQAATSFIAPFERIDGAGSEDEDLTAQLGHGLTLHAATPELSGVGYLVVSDVSSGEYTVSFKAPGDASAGASQSVTDADFIGEYDAGLGEYAQLEPRTALQSDGGRYVVEVSFDIDAWLILWLMREAPITFNPQPAQHELLIPEPELDQGRA